MLYNEPDFWAVESQANKCARESGYQVIFLPKFHCELNFIEQCWGYAKRNYRLLGCPPSTSSAADVLKRNVLQVLSEVPLESIRK
jgi:transposase